ncbi:hypothetical protein [Hyphococcus sp.]|jgi:hypothetical protein|uniref:hypothetical protein n=1 Tax=Hyphococcus sp. TaxID=2038636 RepID=UPI003D0AFF8B
MPRSLRVFAAAIVAIGLSACGGGGDSTAAEPKAAEANEAQLLVRTSSAPAEKPAPKAPLMQVGPWFPASFNIEEPFIDLIHGGGPFWETDSVRMKELLENGVVDKSTLLPTRLPDAKWLRSDLYFTGNSPEMRLHWDGEWVLEWEGDADFMIEFLPRELQWPDTKNSIIFTRDFKRGKTPDHSRLQLRRLKGPLKGLHLYRKENEAAFKAGKIFNPKFVEAVSKYDIVRTMDLQSANAAVIRSVDDLTSMTTPYWGATDWGNATGEPWYKFSNPKQGMPIEAAFRLGVEAGNQVWFQAPMTLGAPEPFFNFRPDDDRRDVWAHRFGEAAGKAAPQVLESEEWDRYADAFVEALIASDYPSDRPLYVSIANEVWNWSGHYFLTTKYAQLMGEGLQGYLPISNIGAREAYGAMVSRLKLAIDDALEEAGRDQKIIYVIEGQAAWIEMTGAALSGAKAYMDKHGEDWASHAPDFGVSVASYWGYNEGVTESGIDPSNLAALEDHFLNGSERFLGTKANVLKLFRGAEREGAKYGVKLIGAYEGGPHFTRPWNQGPDGRRDYLMTEDEYREFIWGERGGRVNYEINKALAEEFPGIILSNYALAGTPGGQPWFEGPLGAQNPYARSWEALMALEAEGLAD